MTTNMAENAPRGTLTMLDPSIKHEFAIPFKRINEGEDVSFWLTTYAYTEIMTFLLQLNASMFPRWIPSLLKIQTWELDSPDIVYSPAVISLRSLISKLEKLIEAAPPDPGPRRFGNMSFRRWYEMVESRAGILLEEHVPLEVLNFGIDPELSRRKTHKEQVTPRDELQKYFLGSFGSAQRLDYGTGHELSFLAFLGCIWKLGGFDAKSDPWGAEERGIVLGVIEPYLNLIRKLILTYTLEPAGSHGVWGLDDHSFLPYIFGSAQLSPAISSPADILAEGSAPNAPKSGDVVKSMTIERERKKNMYFSAIGFIYDVKRGPFWEHSPILFDISGVTAGWAKINKGMIKMYNAEVLSKFPVVQHFPFGSLFPWTVNPSAPTPMATTHTNSQPSSQPSFHGSRNTPMPPSSNPTSASTTSRPPPPGSDIGTTKAPWLSGPTRRTNPATPGASLPGPPTSWTGQSGSPGMPATKAPWASGVGPARLPAAPGPGFSSRMAAPQRVAAAVANSGTGTTATWAKTMPLRSKGDDGEMDVVKENEVGT